MAAEIQVRRQVRFSETDAAGIVHFTCFFRFFEDAEHELWREAGLSIHADNSSIGWPRVSASCEFYRPLKFEQEFDVAVRITEMTERTITYAGEITCGDDKVATGTWRIACVTKSPDGTIRSTNIPADVASRLAPRGSHPAPSASRFAPRASHPA